MLDLMNMEISALAHSCVSHKKNSFQKVLRLASWFYFFEIDTQILKCLKLKNSHLMHCEVAL